MQGIDGNERLIIPLSRRTDPAFIHSSVLFYRVVERVTSKRSAVQRVLLISPRGVIYLCHMDGRVTHSVHCFDLKWIRVIEKPSSILVWCTKGENGRPSIQTMVSFRAEHISNVPVCVLGYFIQVVQSFVPDLRTNTEEAMKANLDLEPPVNIWTRMLQGVRKIRKLDLDDIACISQPTSRVMTETVDDSLIGVANDDDDDANNKKNRYSGDSDDEILGLNEDGTNKKKKSGSKSAPPLIFSDSFSETTIGHETSNVSTSSKKNDQQQQHQTQKDTTTMTSSDDQFLQSNVDQQNNNRARTPMKKNMTEQHLDEVGNDSNIDNINKDITTEQVRSPSGTNEVVGPSLTSPTAPERVDDAGRVADVAKDLMMPTTTNTGSATTLPPQQQLFSTLRITKVSDPNGGGGAFRHHLNSVEGSALQVFRGCKFQLSSFYYDTNNNTTSSNSTSAADITFHEIQEAAFPNAKDFSLVLTKFGGGTTTTNSSSSNNSTPQQSATTTGPNSSSNNNNNVTIIISASWDEPTVLNHQSKADKKKQIFEYYQKLTNRFIRKLQQFYPGINIRTGSSANQDLMQLSASVHTLNKKLGDLHRQTHKLVNEIRDDDDDDNDVNIPGTQRYLIEQEKALARLVLYIVEEKKKHQNTDGNDENVNRRLNDSTTSSL